MTMWQRTTIGVSLAPAALAPVALSPQPLGPPGVPQLEGTGRLTGLFPTGRLVAALVAAASVRVARHRRGQRQKSVPEDKDIYYFNRDVEKSYFKKLLGSNPLFTILIGPINSGKTRFIRGVAEDRKSEQALVIINLRGKDVTTTDSLTDTILDAVGESLPEEGRKLFIQKRSICANGPGLPDERASQALASTKRLEAALNIVEDVMNKKSYGKYFPQLELNPVLVIDDAQLLYRDLQEKSEDSTRKAAYDILIGWVVRMSKEERKFHIIFVSSAPAFFNQFSTEVQSQMKPVFLGDLDEETARTFWQKVGGAEDRFEEVYHDVGGHMYDLEGLAQAPNLDKALKLVKMMAFRRMSQFVASCGVDAVIAMEKIVNNGGYVTSWELQMAVAQYHGFKTIGEAEARVTKMVYEHGLLERVSMDLCMDLSEKALKEDCPIITAQRKSDYNRMADKSPCSRTPSRC